MRKSLVIAASLFMVACGGTKSEEQSTTEHSSSVKETLIESNLPKEVKLQVDTLLNSYYGVKDGLVASNFAAVQQEAKALVKKGEQLNLSLVDPKKREVLEKELTELLAASFDLSTAMDLKTQRIVFKRVTDRMYVLIGETGMSAGKVYQQYCPMAFNNEGASWLSKDEAIRNPYFGDEMLECGEVTAISSFK